MISATFFLFKKEKGFTLNLTAKQQFSLIYWKPGKNGPPPIKFEWNTSKFKKLN